MLNPRSLINIDEGMVIVRILDGIAKNVYNGNPGKYAAWVSAKHVEKDPKSQGGETA